MRILFLFLAIFCISCSDSGYNVRNYDFIVRNKTHYTINIMNVGQNEIAINPFDTSDLTRVTYSGYSYLQPNVEVSVSNYSDSNNSYENKGGWGIWESDLKENKINFVTIQLDTLNHNDDYIFTYELEN